MKSKRKTIETSLAETIISAIERSEFSRYRISQETGVSETSLSRFMNGSRMISLDAADKLCKFLRLELRESEE
jgi:transcriptional regulator with XRE-family HTH domain